MNIPEALAAELALLDEVLDGTPADIATALSLLVSEAALAVPSYLGLCVQVRPEDGAPWEFTTFESDARVARIATSLRFTLGGGSPAEGASANALIVYAAQPGALVDLAADLAWLTGRPLGDARLDEDLAGPEPARRDGALPSWSAVNQALGVLIGGGLTPEEAERELDARAAATGRVRHLAAAELLDSLPVRLAATR